MWVPRHIDWLWENWIAIGKVSVLAGEGGKGKSTILCDWAARTTNGELWPDGAEGLRRQVVYSFSLPKTMSRIQSRRA